MSTPKSATQTTGIAWTNHTINFWWGCDKVSPACTHCYAEAWSKYTSKKLFGHLVEWGQGKPRGARLEAARAEALKLNKKAGKDALRGVRDRPRVFINSMSDWLDEEVPIEWLAYLLETLFMCPNLDFQLLTKRPENWRKRVTACYMEHAQGNMDFDNWLFDWTGQQKSETLVGIASIPPPNLWIGTTVESQEWADKRIPHLLAIPAAIRFLSCEPLLGPVDLTGWAEKTAVLPSGLPTTWEDYTWPDWISLETRNHIQRFWGSNHHSGPADWIKDNVAQRTPTTGSRVGILSHRAFASICTPEESPQQGRWVHKWNNIGCVITDEGEVIGASSNQGTLRLSRYLHQDGSYQHKIHWVIAGGESGGHARPSHPDWFRSLRDQCATAGVPFFFKQWGEWISVDNLRHLTIETPRLDKPYKGHKHPDQTLMLRVGTKHTGSLLDGVKHSAFPTA